MKTWREIQEVSKQAAEAVRAEWIDGLISTGRPLVDVAADVGVRPSTLVREAQRLGRMFDAPGVTDPESRARREERRAHLREVYEAMRVERMERAADAGRADAAEFRSARAMGQPTPIVRPRVAELLGNRDDAFRYRELRTSGMSREEALVSMGREDLAARFA